MPRTPTPPVTSEIPRWPATSAALNADGSGRLTINGRREDLQPGDLAASRELVKQRVTSLAEELGHPVRLTSTDPDGAWELAIGPDGSVRELAAHPTPAAAAGPAAPTPAPAAAALTSSNGAPPPTPDPPLAVDLQPDGPTVPLQRNAAPRSLSRAQRKWAGTTERPERALRRTTHPTRRTATRLGVALALLVGIASAIAIIVTNGPATVAKQATTTKAPVARNPAAPGAITKVMDDARRASQQRIAEAARLQHARSSAAAAKRAQQRRLLRVKRQLRRRVAARNARRRAAAQRRSAVAQPRVLPRPQAQPRPATRPRPSAPPPPPPPPPPAAQPACGEFDLC